MEDCENFIVPQKCQNCRLFCQRFENEKKVAQWCAKLNDINKEDCKDFLVK